MASPTETATTVLKDYFAALDTDRPKAAATYLRPISSFGSGNGVGQTTVGDEAILAMLNAYPPTKHTLETVYALPSVGKNLVALVTGSVTFGTASASKFSEAFELVEEQGTYWVLGAIVTIVG